MCLCHYFFIEMLLSSAKKKNVFTPLKALDLWMAGCMIFVFAALGEFVVVKVLDVQYQYQINRVPKVLPMVKFTSMLYVFCQKKKKKKFQSVNIC